MVTSTIDAVSALLMQVRKVVLDGRRKVVAQQRRFLHMYLGGGDPLLLKRVFISIRVVRRDGSVVEAN